ncbi:MAG: type transport system ATP-binding protein [Pseudonocardiales bacterium]|nr:type transport system ATP-binding protein [Pseudonocardiales bacterium]
MSTAIEVAGVGKRYVKYHDQPMLAHALVRLAARSRHDHLWALRNVDLTVETGECVGVIGRNGSGKSTLLQLLGGITAPTEGTVTVHGRVAPLISVGVGFHPELTGRDNVFLNGSILGMRRRDIEDRFDAIVDFAEIEEFIDTPVKFYSSGMQVRLGFAVAVQADPQVLLVDEVLAVGDFAFQLKCLRRIDEIRAGGASVLLVSHNLAMVERLCPRTAVLHEGKLHFEGPTLDAISTLHALLGEDDELPDGVELLPEHADVTSFALYNGPGPSINATTTGTRVTARMAVRAHRDVARPFVGMTIAGPRGDVIFHQANGVSPFPPLSAGEEREYAVSWTAQVPTGSYVVRAHLGSVEAGDRLAILSNAQPISLFVRGKRGTHGVVDVEADFAALD